MDGSPEEVHIFFAGTTYENVVFCTTNRASRQVEKVEENGEEARSYEQGCGHGRVQGPPRPQVQRGRKDGGRIRADPAPQPQKVGKRHGE